MSKRTFLYACTAAFGAIIGFLLRDLELQLTLDHSTMLMDLSPVSLILLLITAAALAAFVLLSRGLPKPGATVGYGECFSSRPVLVFSLLSALLMVTGAIVSLTRRRSDGSRILVILAVLAVLSALGWLVLSLFAYRRRFGACRLWAAAMPELMACLFLILFYKVYAPQPSLLYVLYPFLGLCAALAAAHLLAGYTVRICRPGLTLFCCGAAAVLCTTAIPGVSEWDFRLYLLAFALHAFVHGLYLFRVPEEPPVILDEGETLGDVPEADEAQPAAENGQSLPEEEP